MVRVKACSPLSAMAGVKVPPQGTGVCICEITSSQVIMILSLSCRVSWSRASRIMKNRNIPSQEGMYMFYVVAAVVHMFVFIVVLYAAEHGKECVTERVRVESTDLNSLVSHSRGQNSSPRYRCMHSSCQVMSSCFCCFPVQLSGVSRTRTREVPPQEGVCIFAVAAVVYVCIYCCFVCSRARKGVCD